MPCNSLTCDTAPCPPPSGTFKGLIPAGRLGIGQETLHLPMKHVLHAIKLWARVSCWCYPGGSTASIHNPRRPQECTTLGGRFGCVQETYTIHLKEVR